MAQINHRYHIIFRGQELHTTMWCQDIQKATSDELVTFYWQHIHYRPMNMLIR